jgi:hypothetical protein
VGHPDPATLRAIVEELASYPRPSASAGERRAAEWIAERLRALGFTTRIEEERAHGTYWWPVGVPLALASVAGLAALRTGAGTRTRAAAVATGVAAAAAIADDTDVPGQRLRRALYRQRSTWNVVAEGGDPAANTHVVLMAHHDAARAGLIFHPGPRRFLDRRFPRLARAPKETPPVVHAVIAGPLLIAAGAAARRRGLVRGGLGIGAFFLSGMIDMAARQPTVAGADDNLSAVAAVLEAARLLQEDPPAGLRLTVLSTGSEESLLEGMRAFARRNFGELDRRSTTFVCLDTVGSPELVLFEGEGMLRMRDYDEPLKDLTEDVARRNGIGLRRGMRLRNATDGAVALAAGYRAVAIASMGAANAPSNYHWPTDVPENLDWDTVEDVSRLAYELAKTIPTMHCFLV